MGNKQGELEVVVCEGRYDTVAIAETWWDETHDWNMLLKGNNLFKSTRPNKRGGGVALYVKNYYS